MSWPGAQWSAKEMASLRELAAEGLSSTVIGNMMVKTKGAVIGMAHRNSIPLIFKRPLQPDGEHRREVARLYMAKKRKAPPSHRVIHDTRLRAQPVKKQQAKPFTFTLDDLDMADGDNPKMCRFPSPCETQAPYHFCGLPTMDGFSYCAVHVAMTHKSFTLLSENIINA